MSINGVDLPGGSIDETQETFEEREDYIEEGDASGSSSSSYGRFEALSSRENYDQDVAQSAPSFPLRDVVASVTPISIPQSSRVQLDLNPTLAAPLPVPLALLPPIAETISSQAGFRTQNDHQTQHFPSQGVLDGERITRNHCPPVPTDHHHQSIRIGPTNYNYLLPTTNLPSNFRLDSSSATRTAAPQSHRSIPRYMATLGNGNTDFSTLRNRRHNQDQLLLIDTPSFLGQQEYGTQGVMGPAFATSNFYQGDDSHQMQVLNMPYQTRMGAPVCNPLRSSDHSNNKMSMNLFDSSTPTSSVQVNWSTPRRSFLVPTPPTNRRCPKNSLYDPSYETMGLPVDPHLRIFLAKSHARNDEDK